MSAALEEFEEHRARLLRIAHRMLGSISDAEDVVQDAYLRWHESDRSDVRAVAAVLVKIVVRLAIDRQRRLKTERATYQGNWLPEPWAGSELDAERSDDMSYASLVLLERLSADERAAFLLREVFDYDYAVVADCLDKSEAACRKLVQRAKERLTEAGDEHSEPTVMASREAKQALLRQFLAATRAETIADLQGLFVERGRLVSDGGGKVFAARYPVLGAARVAQTMFRSVYKRGARLDERLGELAGEPVLVSWLDGTLWAVSLLSAEPSKIHTLYMILNPDKLARLSPRFAGLR